MSVVQVTADALVRLDIKAIVNFCPWLCNADLAVNLEILTSNLGIAELTESLIARPF